MKQKYIPGDWVKFEGKLARVEEVYQSYYFLRIDFESYNPSIDLDFPYVYKGDEEIKPIPLTPEILEKNGWDKEEKDGSVFSLSEAFMGGDENDEDNYTCFQLYYQNKKDGWVIDMRGEPLKFEVHYVHELQHLFFGLSINHEMEV